MLMLRSSALFLCALLTACASLPDGAQIEASAEIQAGKSITSVASLMQNAKLELAKGNNDELAVFAPSYLQQATTSYEQALLAEKSGDEAAVRRFAIQTSKYLQAGQGVKTTVLTTLEKTLQRRNTLIELDASKHFPEDQKQVDLAFNELVLMIEQQKVNQAREAQTPVIKQMRALEVKAVSYIHLSQAEDIYQQAMKLGADKLVPTTVQETDHVLNTARQLISQNPKDKSRILEQAQASTFAAERLYHLTRMAQRFQVAEASQLEGLLLDMEKAMTRIQSALKIEDIRNLSLNDQSLVLEERSKEVRAIAQGELIKSDRKITQAELDKWRRKVVLLQGEVRRLQRALEENN